MESAFRKIASVGSLTGGTKWYLSEDCLLAAKRVMYSVEYQRFYLCDLESIVVWPTRMWLLRLIVPGVLFAILGVSIWHWVDSTAGAISWGIGLAWVALEAALGPTAGTRIRTTGACVDLPLVSRTRRARKVLAKIDAAVHAARGVIEQTIVIHQAAEPQIQLRSESSPVAAPITAVTQTNGS